jgi:hypothetical protein
MYVCVRARVRVRERERACVCVCVCVSIHTHTYIIGQDTGAREHGARKGGSPPPARAREAKASRP